MFEKAEIDRDAIQQSPIGPQAPQAGAQPQGPGVVVGRVTAFAARDRVNGMLNQSGRIGHSVQMPQLQLAASPDFFAGAPGRIFWGGLRVRKCFWLELAIMNTHYETPDQTG